MTSPDFENIVGVGRIDLKNDIQNSKADYMNAIISAINSAGFGSPDCENPLTSVIKPGYVVVLKPNWVNHINFRKNFGTNCLYTNPLIIECALDLISVCKPKKVIIGDAPIQGCELEKIASSEWCNNLHKRYSFDLDFIDFRQVILSESTSGKIKYITSENQIRRDNDYILFDLGPNSSLEDISDKTGKFRVVMYNHFELNKRHRKGIHQYLISKEILEADVIINLPKLKTHKKTGITGAMKNIVGIIGSKDYLPHHRVGSLKKGGDNYSEFSLLKRVSEFFTDQANIRIGNKSYSNLKSVANFFASLSNKTGTKTDFEGGWYGNQTTWRMVLDLNKIALYGNIHGKLNSTPLRKIYSLTDAVIAGDTDGPLSVEPVKLGLITFASSSAFADLVHSRLMGFDWEKIPCIRESFKLTKFPIVKQKPQSCCVFIDGIESSLDEIGLKYGIQFRPPQNWVGHIELNK